MVIHAPIYISHLCLPLVPCSHFPCGRLCLSFVIAGHSWSSMLPSISLISVRPLLLVVLWSSHLWSLMVKCVYLLWSFVVMTCSYGQSKLFVLSCGHRSLSLLFTFGYLWSFCHFTCGHLWSYVFTCGYCDRWSFAIFPAHMVNPCHFCSPLMITCGYLWSYGHSTSDHWLFAVIHDHMFIP